jgi:hypothetical protein
VGAVIFQAWSRGALFDAWQDINNYEAWMAAFETTGLDPAFYTHRQRDLDEVFPWDHIHPGVKKSFLLQDYQWSLESRLRTDCRQQCYACGILPTFAPLRRKYPGPDWKCPEVSKKPQSIADPIVNG